MSVQSIFCIFNGDFTNLVKSNIKLYLDIAIDRAKLCFFSRKATLELVLLVCLSVCLSIRNTNSNRQI